MHYNYCPVCGRKLIDKKAGDDRNVPYCESCRRYWFDSFSTCIIVLVVNEFQEVVLLRQGYLSDRYASLVAGYMTPGESAEEAARREVREEIGVNLDRLDLEGTYWFDKNGLLMIGFIGRARKSELRLSAEVDSASWVPAADVPKYIFPKSPGNAAYAVYEKYMAEIGQKVPAV